MAQRKRPTSGRVTPKGTTDPTTAARAARAVPPAAPGTPPHELRGGAGKQRTKAIRPITHNRGNR